MRVTIAAEIKLTFRLRSVSCVLYMYMYMCVQYVASYTAHNIIHVSVIYTYMYYSAVNYFVTAGRGWCTLGGITHAWE